MKFGKLKAKDFILAGLSLAAFIALIIAYVYVMGLNPPWYIGFWSVVAILGCLTLLAVKLYAYIKKRIKEWKAQ